VQHLPATRPLVQRDVALPDEVPVPQLRSDAGRQRDVLVDAELDLGDRVG
jgi:hypothetical protein